MSGGRRLVFVYNLDSSASARLVGVYSALTTRPTNCRLSDLTHGRVLRLRAWNRFVGSLPVPATFETRSRFLERDDAPPLATFPAAYLESPAGLVEVIGPDDIDGADDLDGLCRLVDDAVERICGGS